MNGIVERTRGARRVTLRPGPSVLRTSGTFVPQTRTALGQGPTALLRRPFITRPMERVAQPGQVVRTLVGEPPSRPAGPWLLQWLQTLFARPAAAPPTVTRPRPSITVRPIEVAMRPVFGPARPGKPLPPAVPPAAVGPAPVRPSPITTRPMIVEPPPLVRPSVITTRPMVVETLPSIPGRGPFIPAEPGGPVSPKEIQPSLREEAEEQLRRLRGSLGQGEDIAFFFLPEEPAPSVPTAEVLREGPLFFEEAVGGEILLARGDRGDPVRNLQLQLRRLGFPTGVVDGIFGPLTEQAVRLFQESVGLPGTGAVDQATWSLLQSGTSPTAGAVSGPVAAVPVPEILREQVEVPAPLPTERPTPIPEVLREREAGRPALPAEEARPGEFLGLPTGVWVALGVVVAALFATAPAAPRPVLAPVRR